MATSRRKQRTPKLLNGKKQSNQISSLFTVQDDGMLFVLPNELKYDEKSNEIITQTDLEENHQFGPFPATSQIEDQIESFQLLDLKHNWIIYCSISEKSIENLNISFQNNQLFLITKQSIPSGTRLYLNKKILPEINMNENIWMKTEVIEKQFKKAYPLTLVCEQCGVRFRNENTLNAHRQHYCIKTTASTGLKRKSTDNLLSAVPIKRIFNEDCCSKYDILSSKSDNISNLQMNISSWKLNKGLIPFNQPIQIGQFIYVPIPIVSSDTDSKPLDLSKPKKSNDQYKKESQFYQCKFCSIHFQSSKTLNAHQENYCHEYKNDHPSFFMCCLCPYQSKTHYEMHMHLQIHSSKNDMMKKSINNDLSFKCNICLAMFNNDDILANHIKTVHTNEKLLECLQCQSRFCSKWNLIQHMKLIHNNMQYDEKLIQSKNFNRMMVFKKKFSCPFCQIKFGNINTLHQHMSHYCSSRLIVNYRKNNNLLYCSSCQISFQHKTSYDAHKMYYCSDQTKTYVQIDD